MQSCDFFFFKVLIQICCSVDFIRPFFTNFISQICMRPPRLYPLAPVEISILNWMCLRIQTWLCRTKRCHKIHETNMKCVCKNDTGWIWENDTLNKHLCKMCLFQNARERFIAFFKVNNIRWDMQSVSSLLEKVDFVILLTMFMWLVNIICV